MTYVFDTDGLQEIRCRENRIELVYSTKDKAFYAYWKEHQKVMKEIQKIIPKF